MKRTIMFLNNLLSSDKGSTSSKRFIGIIGAFALIIAMFGSKALGVSDEVTITVVESVTYVTIGALLGTSIEKIWPNINKTENEVS